MAHGRLSCVPTWLRANSSSMKETSENQSNPLRKAWDRAAIVQALRDRRGRGMEMTAVAIRRTEVSLWGAMYRYFGNYRTALQEAGIDSPKPIPIPWDKDKVVAALRDRTARGLELKTFFGHSGKVTDFRQDEYMAYFRTTAGPAEDIFVADTPEHALELARKTFTEDASKLGFSPADCGFVELQEIRIVNQDGEELVDWMTDEYRLQRAAPQLLEALESQVETTRRIIDACNTDGFPDTVHDLIDALDRLSDCGRAVLDAWENGDLVSTISNLEDSLPVALKAIAEAKGGAA